MDRAIIVVNAARLRRRCCPPPSPPPTTGRPRELFSGSSLATLRERDCEGRAKRARRKVRDGADAKTRRDNKKGGNDSVDYF